jgi:hypothetical protein
MGETPTHRRLGKINDRAYEDWQVFLRVAGDKMGVDLPRLDPERSTSDSSALVPPSPEPALDATPPSHALEGLRSEELTEKKERTHREVEAIDKQRKRRRRRTESGLEVLHTLRCLLGSLVESMILLDRLVWVREELAGIPCGVRSEMEVELVNLFDQATGSGRNVGLVIKPAAPTLG